MIVSRHTFTRASIVSHLVDIFDSVRIHSSFHAEIEYLLDLTSENGSLTFGTWLN